MKRNSEIKIAKKAKLIGWQFFLSDHFNLLKYKKRSSEVQITNNTKLAAWHLFVFVI